MLTSDAEMKTFRLLELGHVGPLQNTAHAGLATAVEHHTEALEEREARLAVSRPLVAT